MKQLYKICIVLMLSFGFLLINSCTEEEPEPYIPPPITGVATFWINADFQCGDITVTCNGISRDITGFYSSQTPACGASGTASFELLAGTYTFTAACSNKTWSGSVTVTAGGCSKMQLTRNGGPVGGSGQATFWTASDLGVGNITVVCNGTSQIISNYFSGAAPGCGTNGCANFNLNPGTYSYSASGGSLSWNGSVTVTSNGCSKQQLLGSGGGGGSTGKATFWVASNLGGNVSVTCNGITRYITSYFSSGAPSCGAGGCANFDLSPGTYSYTASSGSLTWNGSVTVTSNGCFKQQLLGSGGGGNGNLMVWTGSDHGCGPISVTVSGYQGTVNSYYTTAPSCGANGCANFTLAPGTYSVSASCGSFTWNGSSVVTSGGCSKLKLN